MLVTQDAVFSVNKITARTEAAALFVLLVLIQMEAGFFFFRYTASETTSIPQTASKASNISYSENANV